MFKLGANLIIRPPRPKYNPNEIPTLADVPGFGQVERTSIAFQNPRHETLLGSFYRAPERAEAGLRAARRVCAVYLHGNASNQLEGRYLVSLFVPIGVSVFCFDFAGCGCSSGRFVSLGHFEEGDLSAALDLLREDFGIGEFLLWGRSMGAAVSLTAAEKCPLVSAVVADSPYASLRSLIAQLGRARNCPRWLIRSSFRKVRKKVRERAGFDIAAVRPIGAVAALTKPVFFVHGEDDAFVAKGNSQRLFQTCPAQVKELHIVPGEHNSERPPEIVMAATEFLCRAAGINIEFKRPSTPSPQPGISQNSGQHFGNVDEMINSM